MMRGLSKIHSRVVSAKLQRGFFMFGGGKSRAYQIQRSLRFRSSASAYANYTPSGTPALGTKCTISLWLKRASLNSDQELASCHSGGVYDLLRFTSANAIMYLTTAVNDTFSYGAVTTSVFRDPSAFMHIVMALDTTLATAADRVKIYVNGTLQTISASGSGYPVQNSNVGFMRQSWVQNLGRYSISASNYFDGYMAEARFVDGQALLPSNFGQLDANGFWQPKKYTGTYGTNGFYLDFSDPSTATTLMVDRSGNGNNWTANNISVSTGATYDSMLDAALGGGGGERGNYCILNPLHQRGSVLVFTPTEGNLRAGASSNATAAIAGSIGVNSGKWYFECVQNADTNSNGVIGLISATGKTDSYVGFYADGYGYCAKSNLKYNSNVGTTYGSGSSSNGDVLMCAYDATAGKLFFGKNGVWFGSGDPVAGTNAAFTGLSGDMHPAFGHNAGSTQTTDFTFNFGQRPFAYTPPSGFKALHTGNLSSTTVITSGSFAGNLSADGPMVWCNGTPETLTINGNAVTWGTHADRLANGFKLRTSSSSYNASGTNTWSATYLSPSTKSAFKYQNAKGNP